jgi:hypothetical protein
MQQFATSVKNISIMYTRQEMTKQPQYTNNMAAFYQGANLSDSSTYGVYTEEVANKYKYSTTYRINAENPVETIDENSDTHDYPIHAYVNYTDFRKDMDDWEEQVKESGERQVICTILNKPQFDETLVSIRQAFESMYKHFVKKDFQYGLDTNTRSLQVRVLILFILYVRENNNKQIEAATELAAFAKIETFYNSEDYKRMLEYDSSGPDIIYSDENLKKIIKTAKTREKYEEIAHFTHAIGKVKDAFTIIKKKLILDDWVSAYHVLQVACLNLQRLQIIMWDTSFCC